MPIFIEISTRSKKRLIPSPPWNRKDRLDGLSFLLDRVDKQDFAGISKAEVSEIYLHVSQPTRKRLAFFC